MKGVSEVIVIVLILMITAAMASLAFMFFSDTASSVSSTTSSVADSAAQALSTSMTIDGIAANAVYVKNTGKNDLKDFAIFINDAQTLNFTNDHPTLRPGETAIIRIYNYLVEGDKITVSTPSGYQYAYADPCKSAVLCLKLDNMTGSSVYDSSPQHVNGTIYTRRENRIRYSQDYSNGAWSGYCGTKNNTIYNTTDVAAPDGTYTATKWTIDPVITCAGSSRGVLQYASPALVHGTYYTASVWLKGNSGGETVYMGLNDGQMTAYTITSSWKRYVYKNTYNSTYSRGMQFFSTTPNAVYYAWGAQVEAAESESLYTISTSAAIADGAVPYSNQFPSPLASGKYGNGIQFDGSGNYIQIPKGFTNNSAEITFEAWINSRSTAGSNIFNTGADATILHFRGAGFYLKAQDATTSGYLGWSSTIPTDQWVHVAATWSASEGIMKLFVNGVKQSSEKSFAGGSTGKLLNSTFLWIGHYFNAGQSWFNGTIDEVRVYNRAIY